MTSLRKLEGRCQVCACILTYEVSNDHEDSVSCCGGCLYFTRLGTQPSSDVAAQQTFSLSRAKFAAPFNLSLSN